MTISSMESLDAMPVGSQIRVESRNAGRLVFDRTEQGWAREGTPLPTSFFAGYLTDGKVADMANLTPTVGSWYESARYWYWVLTVDTQHQQTRCLRFYRSGDADPTPQIISFATLTGSRVHPLNAAPAGVATPRLVQWALDKWQDAEAKRAAEAQVTAELRAEKAVLKNRPEPGALREGLASVDAAIAALRALIGGDLEA
jgi:hypothetical protein